MPNSSAGGRRRKPSRRSAAADEQQLLVGGLAILLSNDGMKVARGTKKNLRYGKVERFMLDTGFASRPLSAEQPPAPAAPEDDE
jgi:hypothetical protein